MKKRILFLSFNFPFGPFGPSTNCTTRIMEALAKEGKYDVFNLSYEGISYNYRKIAGITINTIPLSAPSVSNSRLKILKRIIHSLVFFPFSDYFFCRRVYNVCKKRISNSQYDLVIAQCNPEESIWTGTWLKQNGIGNKHMVLFWDNIYGKMQFKFIPKWFALWRQRKAERIIADNADLLVSLYPIRRFHTQYGDIPEAAAKRIYLGIPSIIKPQSFAKSSYQDVIRPEMINILFSGTIFRAEDVQFVIDLFDRSKFAKQSNLIFFERGVELDVIRSMGSLFQGKIVVNDWIPLDDLLSIYPSVNFFISFPGLVTAIRSKVFEYMSYGKPLFLLYDNDADVNRATFSLYPAYHAIDTRMNVEEHVLSVDSFIETNMLRNVPFEEVEALFPDDSVQAYVKAINALLNQ